MFFKNKIKIKYKKLIFDIIGLVIGTFFMACSTAFFLLPNKLSTGGFSGIATIAYYFLNIPAGVGILILNIPLFILAYFRIGKNFIFKTIVGTILLSFFIDKLESFNTITNDSFLACIYGGILMGIGTSITLKANGSTGGSDLLSYIVRSYYKKIKSSDLIIFIDIIIISISIVFFREVEIGLYSAIAIYLMGKMIDIFFEGINFTKVLFIISDKYEEISKTIGDKIQRGSTGIYAKGMHSGSEKIMLFCVGSRNEIIHIKEIVTTIDPKSFIVIANSRETWGKGFKNF